MQMLPAGNSTTMVLTGFGPHVAGLVEQPVQVRRVEVHGRRTRSAARLHKGLDFEGPVDLQRNSQAHQRRPDRAERVRQRIRDRQLLIGHHAGQHEARHEGALVHVADAAAELLERPEGFEAPQR